ncbi:MAG: hypothetical protein JSR78_08910 [Proteobacteria bacterium]|nr:hypothetical protein [Pseudomonadota bacterium]
MLIAVLCVMSLSSFFVVMLSVQVMSVCQVGVVSGLLVVARLMVLSGFVMMFRCVLVMLGSLMMMVVSVVSHSGNPFLIGLPKHACHKLVL